MSIKAVSWALEQPIGGNLKLVLIALADSHSEGRGCFPSIETIIKKAHISKPTYKRVIAQLEERGYVTRQERFTDTGRRTSNTFLLHFGVGDQFDAHVGDQIDTGEGYHGDTGVGLTADTHLTVNSKGNGKVNKSADALDLPAGLSANKWCEWEQHRLEIKKRLTPSTIKKQINFLAKQPDPSAVIDASITNGWTGLFTIKSKLNGSSVAEAGRAAVDAFLSDSPKGRVFDHE